MLKRRSIKGTFISIGIVLVLLSVVAIFGFHTESILANE